MHRLPRLCALACVLVFSNADAQADKYQITEAERSACTPDAERLCAAAYPDEDKLMGCMRANRKALSTTCAVAFNAGLKRRGLN